MLGEYIPTAELERQRSGFADMFGVDAEHILLTPYGFLPMIQPLPGLPDGRQRIPSGITRVGAIVPNLWMDQYRLMRPGEAVDRYVVRIALALHYMGYYDYEQDIYGDPLAIELNLDIMRDDDAWERVQTFSQGGHDAQLQALQLQLTLPSRDLRAFESACEQMCSLLRSEYRTFLAEQEAAAVAARPQISRDQLQAVLEAEVVSAGGQLCHQLMCGQLNASGALEELHTIAASLADLTGRMEQGGYASPADVERYDAQQRVEMAKAASLLRQWDESGRPMEALVVLFQSLQRQADSLLALYQEPDRFP